MAKARLSRSRSRSLSSGRWRPHEQRSAPFAGCAPERSSSAKIERRGNVSLRASARGGEAAKQSNSSPSRGYDDADVCYAARSGLKSAALIRGRTLARLAHERIRRSAAGRNPQRTQSRLRRANRAGRECKRHHTPNSFIQQEPDLITRPAASPQISITCAHQEALRQGGLPLRGKKCARYGC